MDGYSNSYTITLPTQATPGNIIYTNNVPSGQWITYTINGLDFGTAQVAPIAEKDKKAKKREEDGCVCKKCKEFYPYAEPNQEDGTLICYGCRTRW